VFLDYFETSWIVFSKFRFKILVFSLSFSQQTSVTLSRSFKRIRCVSEDR
jgi:hypothetical protein